MPIPMPMLLSPLELRWWREKGEGGKGEEKAEDEWLTEESSGRWR